MRITSWLCVLCVAASLTGCMQESIPTAVEDQVAESDLGKAAQGDRSEWQLMLQGTIAEGEFSTGFLPCLNGGEGEDAWFVGTYAWLNKTVITPSGNVNLTIRGRIFDDTAAIGMTTGDRWTQTRWISHFTMHTRGPDGLIYLHQPDDGWLRNDRTGEVVKILFHWNQVLDPDWNIVSDESRLVSCTRIGGR